MEPCAQKWDASDHRRRARALSSSSRSILSDGRQGRQTHYGHSPHVIHHHQTIREQTAVYSRNRHGTVSPSQSRCGGARPLTRDQRRSSHRDDRRIGALGCASSTRPSTAPARSILGPSPCPKRTRPQISLRRDNKEIGDGRLQPVSAGSDMASGTRTGTMSQFATMLSRTQAANGLSILPPGCTAISSRKRI